MHNSERVDGRTSCQYFPCMVFASDHKREWAFAIITPETLQKNNKSINILDNVSLSVLILQTYHKDFCLLLYMVLGLIAIPIQSWHNLRIASPSHRIPATPPGTTDLLYAIFLLWADWLLAAPPLGTCSVHNADWLSPKQGVLVLSSAVQNATGSQLNNIFITI